MVPDEVLDNVSVAAEPVLVTALPNWSWTWTANGRRWRWSCTSGLPVTVEVNTSLGVPATMVMPVEVPVTAWPLTVAPATEIVGVPALLSE